MLLPADKKISAQYIIGIIIKIANHTHDLMVDSQSVKNTSEEGINLFLAITFNKNEVKLNG